MTRTGPGAGGQCVSCDQAGCGKNGVHCPELLREYPVETVYVVGGACCFTQFQSVFEKFLGVPVVKPAAPLLVTPLSMTVNCKL